MRVGNKRLAATSTSNGPFKRTTFFFSEDEAREKKHAVINQRALLKREFKCDP